MYNLLYFVPLTPVIDFCLVKELMYDADTNYQCLKLNWASKASLTQRKGVPVCALNGQLVTCSSL